MRLISKQKKGKQKQQSEKMEPGADFANISLALQRKGKQKQQSETMQPGADFTNITFCHYC